MKTAVKDQKSGLSQERRIGRGFWQLADPKIWTASFVPFVLGSSLVISTGGDLSAGLSALAVLVIVLVEIAKNGFNEYYDYQSGADRFVQPVDRTPFSGGKKVIIDGLLSLREVWFISIYCLAAAIVLSIPILILRPIVVWFGVAGVFLSVAYSVPPFRLCYRGLGEAAVGLTFGPIIVNGAYYLNANTFHLAPLLLSIPVGFLIANVLWINEVPDVEADRKAGKWNLVARCGREKAFKGYIVLFIFAYLSIIGAAILLFNPYYLCALITAVPASRSVLLLSTHHSNTPQLVSANSKTIQIYLFTGLILAIASFF